jgi:hypothetical protein
MLGPSLGEHQGSKPDAAGYFGHLSKMARTNEEQQPKAMSGLLTCVAHSHVG